MVAIGEGHLSTAEQILGFGANVNARNSLGQTPMHFAAAAFWGDKPEIVRLLIECGADRAAPDRDGRLPIEYAKEKGYLKTIQLLDD